MERLFFLILLSLASREAQCQSVKLKAHYESMCPDSIRWFKTQFYPTWTDLKAYLTVEFNPFGKADYTPQGNGWSFECQHGPDECEGNLYQSCYIDKETDENMRCEVISCIMSTDPPYNATQSCMSQHNVTDPPYSEIDICANSEEGQNILHQFGVETKALVPPLTWVPTIVINDVYVEEDFWPLQEDLKGVLCRKYLSDVPECSAFATNTTVTTPSTATSTINIITANTTMNATETSMTMTTTATTTTTSTSGAFNFNIEAKSIAVMTLIATKSLLL